MGYGYHGVGAEDEKKDKPNAMWEFVKKNALWIALGVGIVLAILIYFLTNKSKPKRRTKGIGAPKRRAIKGRRRSTGRRKTTRRRSKPKSLGDVGALAGKIKSLEGAIGALGAKKTTRRRRKKAA